MARHLNTSYALTRFTLAGLLCGLICSAFWDPDDYGLVVTLTPGWFFGVTFSLALLSSVIERDIRNVIKLIVWIVICAGCFWAAFSLFIDETIGLHPLFDVAIAGFATTFIMILALRLLFGTPGIISLVGVSVVAGAISALGIYFFLVTESIAPLFILYHVVIGSLLGYSMLKSAV